MVSYKNLKGLMPLKGNCPGTGFQLTQNSWLKNPRTFFCGNYISYDIKTKTSLLITQQIT